VPGDDQFGAARLPVERDIECQWERDDPWDRDDMRMTCRGWVVRLACAPLWAAILLLGPCASATGLLTASAKAVDPNPDIEALKGLFRRPTPPAAVIAPDLAALGARLFRDRRLSSDHRLSCASCHVPELGFIDGRRTARGLRGRVLTRNTPALWNLAPATAFYWDARVTTLDAQVQDAIEREGEMDATLEAAARWLARDPTIARDFQRAGLRLEPGAIRTAIAAYQRTLISPATRFDRWIEGDPTALGEREVAGFRVFTGPGRCIACHGGWRFTDDRLHDIGLPTRGRIAPDGSRRRDFKTPSLREARWTQPYFHDGRARSLTRVVAHYTDGVQARPTLAPILRTPIRLTRRERADLVTFLRTLSGERRPRG
jgi:cytochrome c peroxidase